MSNGIYDLPFRNFWELVKPIAEGLESTLLLSYASQYNILGLPTVALELYNGIDSPNTIQSIAQYLASITPVQQSFSFKPSDVKSIDSMLNQIRTQITLSPEKANMQASLNAQVAKTDPNLAMRVEVEIASNIAFTYLLLGKHGKALKYAKRLSNLDDAVAQYTAAIVYASQGKVREETKFLYLKRG